MLLKIRSFFEVNPFQTRCTLNDLTSLNKTAADNSEISCAVKYFSLQSNALKKPIK